MSAARAARTGARAARTGARAARTGARAARAAARTARSAARSGTARRLRHGRIQLALHELRAGEGRPLLLLHGLGERSPAGVPATAASWPGPVHALDFTGHGASDLAVGGGYTSEHLMSDADVALGELGAATVVGYGLGGYVALLLAGARPTEVRGAVIADGPGLAGGGSRPGSASVITADTTVPGPPDPFALAELARDVRPPDYAATFTRQATQLAGVEWPITVAARLRPEWLTAVVNELGVQEASIEDALALYATLP